MSISNHRQFHLLTALLLLLIVGSTSCSSSTNFESEAYNLIDRLLPQKHVGSFVFKERNGDDHESDFFEVSSEGDKIVIVGNNTVSMVSGLYWYLKNYCGVQVSINYNQVNLPDELPKLSEPIQVDTPFEYRYLFNYCTYGYSMPWWDWEDWEKMIDYMALQGVNMPLSIVGQEAVWQKVFLELGMNQDQIDDFFVGPAHLPWGWMGNIDGIGGPLPQSWITKRKDLQVKILTRMRALGMKPVLQGFTGHVPEVMKEIFPESNIFQIEDWAGIEGTWFLDPTDPLFKKVGTLFIQKQTELFGTDHLYDADCFIEVDPPSNDPEFLKEVSRSVYESMAAADPEAIWVIQGWFFFFKKDFWQPEQGEAFLGAIPENKAIVLDLYGEKNPTWKQTDGFYGNPWIWNVICNEDQKVNMSGDLQAMQDNFQEAFNSDFNNNLKGIGVIPEGIGFNPIIQEFIFEKAWDQSNVDLELWIENYARRRYGSANPKAIQAWKKLLNTVYGRTRTMWSPLITTPRLVAAEKIQEDIRHVRKDIDVTEQDPYSWDFDVVEFHEAAKLLLEAAPELSGNPAYQFDLTHVYRELVHAFSNRLIYDVSQAYHQKDTAKLKKSGDELLKLLDDLESITGTNSKFLLGNWLEDAKAWGDTPEEKAFFEKNARTIVTIWQPWKEGGLRDYAGKTWNGMFSGYYKPRWELFLSSLTECLLRRESFDSKAYDTAVREIDFEWTQANDLYSTEPTGNVIEVASRIEKDYSIYFKVN
ncbi:alpha-N-acetylglucosaminidase [Algoriphagus aquimarinus]|uniref:alpha-N-acetylglucosaminidase n=1 Tax=Algoriphagus aquimarinus TaxID=237018 RepID=UPI0030D95EB2|tara:strand:+ start:11599 stop:13866 length:2268 start_codon:yes stop_codon:yes gene_type:complete